MSRLSSLASLLSGLTTLRQLVRRRPPGTPPGTLSTETHAHPTTVRVLGYGGERLVDEEFTELAQIAEIRASCPVVWFDVDGLGNPELLREIADALGLHPLALEDATTPYQRTKVEAYPEHLFLVVRMVDLGERLHTEQLSIFVGDGFVVTLQGERPGDSLEAVRKGIRSGRGRIRRLGADYLAYSLVDAVIDYYFPVLDELGARLERLEQEVLRGGERDAPARIQTAKYDLMTARRLVWPLRDTTAALVRDEYSSRVSPEVRLHFRDCLDHARQLADVVDSYREVASGLLDLHFSSMSHRMNEVMKVLTLVSTLFIPLSFVAGVYGMNFDPNYSPWNMPELHWVYGYPFALGIMGAMVVLALAYFWRKGWLR